MVGMRWLAQQNDALCLFQSLSFPVCFDAKAKCNSIGEAWMRIERWPGGEAAERWLGEETVAAALVEEEECDWRIIPSCIIPQLSLFIQLDKQIIPSSLFIATIIHRQAGRPKKSHSPQATALFLTSADLQTSTSREGGCFWCDIL